MPRPPGTWERDGVLLKWGAVQRESRMGLRGVLLTRGGPCAAEASHAAGSRAAWGRGVLKGQAGIRACSGPWLRLWRGLGLGPPRHRQRWAAPDRAEARCPERAREVEVSCKVLPIPEFLVQQDLGAGAWSLHFSPGPEILVLQAGAHTEPPAQGVGGAWRLLRRPLQWPWVLQPAAGLSRPGSRVEVGGVQDLGAEQRPQRGRWLETVEGLLRKWGAWGLGDREEGLPSSL